VSKTAANGKAASAVAVLDREARVEEIARMLGGVKITETTRKHAAEMLQMVNAGDGEQKTAGRKR
jgi:DNA repair protein RecN (Recombination protein N)